LKIKWEKMDMDKNFAPEKYGMVICPLCSGKGFLIKYSDQTSVTSRKVCARCGGFGAIKKEKGTFGSLEN
jgi:DnaJ-class molecular chaperone